MKTRIQKWGNSLAVRIPKSFAVEAGLEYDAPVDMSLVDGKLVVKPIVESVLTLESLLEQVTERNIHKEVDTGHPTGNETW
ncbi:MAG: AbrB/MazE/SpoVT family DNA-binding domain-containing protein [Chloroflexota bacterium]|nr:AbrB/MazE/SpoVT family DNA-binding domain-containing protein [Chloroflexota bacterium]